MMWLGSWSGPDPGRGDSSPASRLRRSRIGPVDAQVPAHERGEPGHVLIEDRIALGPELADGGIQVDGRPERHAVQHQAEGAELVLQTALIAVIQLALLPVADLPREGVPAFLEVADALDVAAVGLVDVDVA